MPKLNDQDLIGLVLSDHKASASHLVQLILESGNDTIRDDCQNILTKTLEHQKQLWQAMQQRGWYQVQTATPQELSQIQNQFNHITQQMQM